MKLCKDRKKERKKVVRLHYYYILQCTSREEKQETVVNKEYENGNEVSGGEEETAWIFYKMDSAVKIGGILNNLLVHCIVAVSHCGRTSFLQMDALSRKISFICSHLYILPASLVPRLLSFSPLSCLLIWLCYKSQNRFPHCYNLSPPPPQPAWVLSLNFPFIKDERTCSVIQLQT